MPQTRLISVCMPVYNGQQYLSASLKSVLNQSYKTFELIIVDDASTDQTVDIIKSFTDPRIIYYRNLSCLGQIPNYNKSVTYARGDFVKVMHQDDILAPRCLERQIAVMMSYPEVSFVFCNSTVLDMFRAVSYERILTFRPGLVPAKKILKKSIFQFDANFVGEPPVVLFKKKTFDECAGFNPKVFSANDIELWTRMNLEHAAFYIPEKLVTIRMHSNQVSRTFRRSYSFALRDLAQLFFAFLQYKSVSKLFRFVLIFEFFQRAASLVIGRFLKNMLCVSPDTLLIHPVLRIARELKKYFLSIVCSKNERNDVV